MGEGARADLGRDGGRRQLTTSGSDGGDPPGGSASKVEPRPPATVEVPRRGRRRALLCVRPILKSTREARGRRRGDGRPDEAVRGGGPAHQGRAGGARRLAGGMRPRCRNRYEFAVSHRNRQAERDLGHAWPAGGRAGCAHVGTPRRRGARSRHPGATSPQRVIRTDLGLKRVPASTLRRSISAPIADARASAHVPCVIDGRSYRDGRTKHRSRV